MLVQPTHDCDGILSDLAVVNVAEPMRRRRVTVLQEDCHCLRPILECVAPDLERIHMIAKHATKNRDQTGYRGDGFQWIAMDLNEQRIGINRQQSGKGEHVSWSF